MKPLLSVALPTHNRARYALHAIRSLLAVDDPRLEVVVSDTSTDGELPKLLESRGNPAFGDARLKYLRPAVPLDMTGNHNASIEATEGEFVCLIGDDDTISADALAAAQWALDSGIDSIAPSVVSNYVWPDFRSRYFRSGHASRLYLPKRIGRLSVRLCADALDSALAGAAQGTEGLPKIYHGIVRRSVLTRMRAASGAYFHGSSPDVSGAIGLALCSEQFAVVDYPLTIPGASGGSNTGRSAMNRHKGQLGDESQTRAFAAHGWSRGVPRFFSVETVWAHSALETLARIAPQRVPAYNFARLLGVCRALHPEYAAENDRAAAEAAHDGAIGEPELRQRIDVERKAFRRRHLLRLLRRAMRPTAAGGRLFVRNLETIADAPSALSQHMQRHGWNWPQVLPASSARDQASGPANAGLGTR